MKCLIAPVTLAAVLMFSMSSNAAPESSSFATVEVQRLTKRSADSKAFQVSVKALGAEHQLNLEAPSSSIFAQDFQYMEASTDPATGEVQFNDATPSEAELKQIEKNFYTDAESKAVVSLKESEDGAYQLNGRLNDEVSIRADDASGTHEVVRSSDGGQEGGSNDYINIPRTLTPGKQSRATSYATPEVLVIFDYANTRTFQNDRNKIIDYLGVFFHAINNRYATASDPKIAFKMSGITTISSLSAQPYMENNKSPNGYDIDKTLSDFAKWAYSNSRNTPKYDLIALISGTDMQMKDSNNQWESAVAGLAYLKAACWNHTGNRQYLGSSVSEDAGGFYRGMFTVAHELAHNMGAPHDGDAQDGTGQCSWEDGYIMSYKGWGTKNKFYFSRCSLQLMKNLIDSKEGTCTRTTQASTNIPVSNDNIGDRMNMQQLCVKYTNSTEAVPDPDTTGDELCKNLKCRFPHPTKPGWYSIRTLNHPPGDNVSCGNNKKCVDGDCV